MWRVLSCSERPEIDIGHEAAHKKYEWVTLSWLLLHLSASRLGGRLACAMVLCSPWTVCACAAGSVATLPALGVLAAARLGSERRVVGAQGSHDALPPLVIALFT